ncbi:MAG: cytochrome P460 family protein [candidate division WOR-3 bacterium]
MKDLILKAMMSASCFILISSTKTYYPENYRNWFHVKTLILEEGHPLFEAFGGIHHVYANEKAYKALLNNEKVFPEGSVFVFDLLEVVKENNSVAEGKRKVLAYMKKHGKKLFTETGNWEFAAFAEGDPSKQIVKDAKRECFSCHASQKEKDYIFSDWRK